METFYHFNLFELVAAEINKTIGIILVEKVRVAH